MRSKKMIVGILSCFVMLFWINCSEQNKAVVTPTANLANVSFNESNSIEQEMDQIIERLQKVYENDNVIILVTESPECSEDGKNNIQVEVLKNNDVVSKHMPRGWITAKTKCRLKSRRGSGRTCYKRFVRGRASGRGVSERLLCVSAKRNAIAKAPRNCRVVRCKPCRFIYR